jgi:hypothetical protein
MIHAADKHLPFRCRLATADGLPPPAAALLFAVAALALVAALGVLETPVGPADWLLFSALAIPATLTQLFAIQKPRHQVFHAALVFVIAGVLLLPAPLLVLMCVIQHIPDWFRQRYRWYIQSFNICDYILSSLAAVAAVQLVGSSIFVVTGFVATVGFVLLNRLLLAPMLWLARDLTPRQTRLFTGEDIWVDFSLGAMGVCLAALGEVERWLAPLALAPLVLIYYLQRDGRRLERAYETIRQQNESLSTVNELLRERSRAAMEGLAATVDARDAYTAGHSRRVRSISLAVGEERLGFVERVVPVIRHHHERLDGSGYPDGLRGDGIPLLARIVHVADAFDSMVTTRVYRPRTDPETALEEIRRATGSQFCPDVVAALERAFEAGSIQVASDALPHLAAAS